MLVGELPAGIADQYGIGLLAFQISKLFFQIGVEQAVGGQPSASQVVVGGLRRGKQLCLINRQVQTGQVIEYLGAVALGGVGDKAQGQTGGAQALKRVLGAR